MGGDGVEIIGGRRGAEIIGGRRKGRHHRWKEG